jgi:hypothetical protein
VVECWVAAAMSSDSPTEVFAPTMWFASSGSSLNAGTKATPPWPPTMPPLRVLPPSSVRKLPPLPPPK